MFSSGTFEDINTLEPFLNIHQDQKLPSHVVRVTTATPTAALTIPLRWGILSARSLLQSRDSHSWWRSCQLLLHYI